MMPKRLFIKTCIVTMCSALLAILAGCAPGQAKGFPLLKIFRPAYTPVVMVPEGTELPSKGKLVSIAELTAHPQRYADQFIEVHGFNAGSLVVPACWPHYGPIDFWGLMAAPYISYPGGSAGYEPAMIEVRNALGGLMSSPSDRDGRELYDVMMKKVAVSGWWQLYKDPIGCGQIDPQGTPIPPTMEPNQQTWYLYAVKLQWLESIAVPTP
jgi:hypothetical protein